MDERVKLLMHLVFFFIFTTLIYGQATINSKNTRWFKRLSLSVGGIFPKEIRDEVIRTTYLVIVVGIFILLMFFSNSLNVSNIYMELNMKNFVVLLMSFVTFIQIFFIVAIVIYLWILKKDIGKALIELDWLKVNINQFIYTGYIKPLVIAIFEGVFFFGVLLNTLNERFHLGFSLSMIITILFYCYGKFILRRNRDKQIILLVLGISISVPVIVLVNTLNSLLAGIVFIYIILEMIAFKDIKVRF